MTKTTAKSGWDLLISNEKLEKFSSKIREDIESKVYTEIRTITVNGVEYTVPVKICPPIHATGSMGRPMSVTKGQFNYNKTGNQVK